jgi:hypothetical protein
MRGLAHVPLGITVLLGVDIGLILAATLERLLDTPFGQVRVWLDPDLETSLPTWYSSMQWLCAAVLFAIVPLQRWRQPPPGFAALCAMALLCLLFSIDESIGIHEWLGHKTDALLPEGTRASTPLGATGIWPFVIGIPVILLFAVLIRMMRRLLLPSTRLARRRLVTGLVILFSGALLAELALNVAARTELAFAQTAIEELLEMIGVTFIVWSGYEFVRSYGFVLVAKEPGAPAKAMSQVAVLSATARRTRGMTG